MGLWRTRCRMKTFGVCIGFDIDCDTDTDPDIPAVVQFSKEKKRGLVDGGGIEPPASALRTRRSSS